MRHNGQPVILASSLPPNLISLRGEGEGRGRARVACPACGRWRSIKRGMVTAHRGPHVPGADAWPAELRPRPLRCLGSGQRIRVDLSFEEWWHRDAGAAAHAHAIAPSTPEDGYQQPPPLAPAVHQIAARRTRKRGT